MVNDNVENMQCKTDTCTNVCSGMHGVTYTSKGGSMLVFDNIVYLDKP